MQVSKNDVLTILAEVFEEGVESLLLERKLDSIDAWDSIGVLTLMAEIDEQYNIALNSDEIQDFSIIEDILIVLVAKGIEIVD